VKWPVGVGGKGHEGVSAYVKQIKGSIGDVELSYALQNKIAYSRLLNAAGNDVNPGDDSVEAAAASADWKNARDFFLVRTNAPGEDAFAATNFILKYRQPWHLEGAKRAREFFRPALANVDASATARGYVPLRDSVVKQVEAYWAQQLRY
jgi:phosphate transport system substrate-binding protein